MPELPEVETTVRYLQKKIVGLKITDFWSDRDKPVIQAGGITKFKTAIRGKKVLSVRRRAKFIVVDIEGKKTIFIHQKISGHLLFGKWKMGKDKIWHSALSGPLKDDKKNEYIRLIFFFNNGYQMALSDLRRFGRVLLVNDNKVEDLKELKNLGPEPLEISIVDFKKLFTKKKGNIKPVLMDPYFIAGIGNIYADEILWRVGIHPLSRVENLKDEEIEKIYKATREVLQEGIKAKGSSMDDYRMPSGEKGHFQNMQKAYQKTGKKCEKNDGGIISRVVIGQRSAHFCPQHQVLK